MTSDVETQEQIEFIATIPARANAIGIDGGKDEGGGVRLDVPGDYLVALMALATMRGRPLKITVVPQPLPTPASGVDENQTTLPFPAQGEDRASLTEQLEAAESRGFLERADDEGVATDEAIAPGPGVADAPLPSHIHRYNADGICEDCGEPRWTEEDVGPPVTPATDEDQRLSAGPGNAVPAAGSRARRVHRGLVGKRTRRRAKR